jgi:hypothetical protein
LDGTSAESSSESKVTGERSVCVKAGSMTDCESMVRPMSSAVFVLQVPPSAAAVWITPLTPRIAYATDQHADVPAAFRGQQRRSGPSQAGAAGDEQRACHRPASCGREATSDRTGLMSDAPSTVTTRRANSQS